MDIFDYKKSVKGKNIAVIGIGISNRPLIRFLREAGARVTAYDKRTEAELGETAEELKKIGVETVLGEKYLDELEGEIIFKTPGLRFDDPALLRAKEKGAEVTSEMEVFFDVCPCKIIAVTGSDGKTTTTTLISEILKKSGYTVWLGGNIGKPLLCDTEKMKKDDISVLELSSFQLHTMKKSPDIAVITNITPNHLDFHKTYDEYIDAKKNIMRYQSRDGLLVVNAANEVTARIGGEAKGKLYDFSSKKDAYITLKKGEIVKNGEPILKISDIKIPGMHNVENYMAAIGATDGLAKPEAICEVAKTFGGVPHRIELVRVLDGVSYYNSSIDSSPNRTINTLRVFDKKVILIAGGKDKGIPYDDLGKPIAEKVKTLILIGKTADKIEAALAACPNSVNVIRCKSYDEVVKTAAGLAKAGDIVLLSPASTSFDMFSNFEERGNLFKKLVEEL